MTPGPRFGFDPDPGIGEFCFSEFNGGIPRWGMPGCRERVLLLRCGGLVLEFGQSLFSRFEVRLQTHDS
ncbi:MAG: hypothetical protein RI897_714 [Verrucomicrobiota bacterium]|jgi:hypothetical protein